MVSISLILFAIDKILLPNEVNNNYIENYDFKGLSINQLEKWKT